MLVRSTFFNESKGKKEFLRRSERGKMLLREEEEMSYRKRRKCDEKT